VASIWLNGSYHTTTNQTIREATMSEDTLTALAALRVDEQNLRVHVDKVVRSSVEETLNGLLDAAADQIAARSAKSAQRSAWILERATTGDSLRPKRVR
jgi:hypothetical protein